MTVWLVNSSLKCVFFSSHEPIQNGLPKVVLESFLKLEMEKPLA